MPTNSPKSMLTTTQARKLEAQMRASSLETDHSAASSWNCMNIPLRDTRTMDAKTHWGGKRSSEGSEAKQTLKHGM